MNAYGKDYPLGPPRQPLYTRKVGNGPEVILVIHGMVSSSAFWYEGFAKYLTEQDKQSFTFVFPDLLGYGLSLSTPTNEYSVQEQLERLQSDVLDSLCTSTFHIMGHSYGGLVAFQLAARNAQRVKTLTLLAPAYFNSIDDFNEFVESNAALFIKFVGRLKMSPYLLRFLNSTSDVLISAAALIVPSSVIPFVIWEDMFSTRSFTTISTIIGIQQNLESMLGSREEMFASLAREDVTILIYHGDEDWVVPIEQSKKLVADLHSSAVLYKLPGIGHHFPLTAAREFTRQHMATLKLALLTGTM